MEIVKNLKDDEMLIQACKKLCNDYFYTFASPDISMDKGTVRLYHGDFERLVELAEIGKNVIQGNNYEVVENKREEDVEHNEEQSEPHFKYNDGKGIFDCSECLCETCISCKEGCAENCYNITCHSNYYVDSCLAYNDGHNF